MSPTQLKSYLAFIGMNMRFSNTVRGSFVASNPLHKSVPNNDLIVFKGLFQIFLYLFKHALLSRPVGKSMETLEGEWG